MAEPPEATFDEGFGGAAPCLAGAAGALRRPSLTPLGEAALIGGAALAAGYAAYDAATDAAVILTKQPQVRLSEVEEILQKYLPGPTIQPTT